MPDEATWKTFFHPEEALAALGLDPKIRLAVEFGCGYGTFTLEAARIIRGTVLGFDIESGLVDLCQRKAVQAGLANARFERRDFVADGTGLADHTVDYIMLFNILHAEDPQILLREVRRILAPGGTLAVMHWKYDPQTPRGPSMEIRPRPEDCRRWVKDAGFTEIGPNIHLPPWHYGFTAL
jgi:SAM-dependent methyltransferase